MTPKEFINAVIIYDLKNVSTASAYLSFPLMAISIEFLGKCLDQGQKGWHKGKMRDDFNKAIDELEALKKYRKISKIVVRDFLYNSLRNGMCHSLIPKRGKDGWSIGLSHTDHPHVVFPGHKRIQLHAPVLYEDIKNAALEVIE